MIHKALYRMHVCISVAAFKLLRKRMKTESSAHVKRPQMDGRTDGWTDGWLFTR